MKNVKKVGCPKSMETKKKKEKKLIFFNQVPGTQ